MKIFNRALQSRIGDRKAGVILLCIIGCVLLLVRDRAIKREATAVNFPEFEPFVEQMLAAEDETTRRLLRRLQYAEAAMIRGNQSSARAR